MTDFIVGITGASGSIYGIRLIEELLKKNHFINVVITDAGKEVMKEEIGEEDITSLMKKRNAKLMNNIKVWENNDFEAPFMSGSNAFDAVIIIPCSVGKLAAIANGISNNLLERAADVALKENKQLILVIRETPLSLIHLENMVKIARAGAKILPAMPAFYHHPQSVDDIVNFVVGKVLNLLNIKHKLFRPWRKNSLEAKSET